MTMEPDIPTLLPVDNKTEAIGPIQTITYTVVGTILTAPPIRIDECYYTHKQYKNSTYVNINNYNTLYSIIPHISPKNTCHNVVLFTYFPFIATVILQDLAFSNDSADIKLLVL